MIHLPNVIDFYVILLTSSFRDYRNVQNIDEPSLIITRDNSKPQITATASNAGAAADKAAYTKINKCDHLNITRKFVPFALETGGS